jgi:hypothetical protein
VALIELQLGFTSMEVIIHWQAVHGQAGSFLHPGWQTLTQMCFFCFCAFLKDVRMQTNEYDTHTLPPPPTHTHTHWQVVSDPGGGAVFVADPKKAVGGHVVSSWHHHHHHHLYAGVA